MDKKGLIHEHSKIKLELYRLYLERYLAVLLSTPFFDSIIIHDIFAGAGISENNEKGSAVIAAETIEEIKKTYNRWSKEITLNLNDSDPENYADLNNYLQNDFIKISNEDADKLIESWVPAAGSHNLFFIDPHGYTQISPANLKNLFSYKNCDFLIFIPLSHIYRFLRPSDTVKQESKDFFSDSKNKGDSKKFYESIANFLSGLGIEKENAKKARSVEEFAAMIVEALKSMSGSPYAYSQMLENKENNSKYCVFFISHNILGAEKFLEAQGKLKEKLQEPTQQQSFDFISTSESILNFAEYNYAYSNVTLYELGIKCGIRPTHIINEIKNLENQKNGSVQIIPFLGKKRNKKGLYIDHDHFKKGNEMISITFKNVRQREQEFPPML